MAEISYSQGSIPSRCHFCHLSQARGCAKSIGTSSLCTDSATVINIGLDLAKQYPLRGYDAVQLASALFLNRLRIVESLSPIVFLSADERVNKVALAEGLLVENPNNH